MLPNTRIVYKPIIVFVVAAVILFPLFIFGLGFPLASRVRGDAQSYLLIASQIDSMGAVFGYAGERTIGFPLFAAGVRQSLIMLTSNDNLLFWIDAICGLLLATHLLAAWFFSIWARRTHLILAENSAYFLFIFLATYPALIGHTTSPLTDTFAVDFILLAVVILERSLKTEGLYRGAMLGGVAGLFFAYAILVRPGAILGVASAMTIWGCVSLLGTRRNALSLAATVIGCMVLLAPFVANCSAKYGQVCVQSPNTVDFVASAQSGLKGARTLWSKLGLVPGAAPVLPDEFMMTHYFDHCKLTSILGTDDSSLTGCLLSRPLTTPVFLVKKWMGLFDHFRFTPYLELDTPSWLVWRSRAYDAIAWAGLALCAAALFQIARRTNREKVRQLFASNVTPIVLGIYSAVTLAQQTAMHIEDRYGLPLVPICALMLVVYGERTMLRYRSRGWASVIPIALYCMVAIALFVTQIVVWDSTPFL